MEIRLSGTHPAPDICDLHAKQDKYGLGPGLYPKGQAPRPPFHPFCRCLLRPRIDLVGAKIGRERKGAGAAYLRSLSPGEAARVAGSKAKQDAILDGASVEKVIDAGKPKPYLTQTLTDVSSDGKQHDAMMASMTNLQATPAKPYRSSWPADFPRVDIHAKEWKVKAHPSYTAAKAGDLDAALQLVDGVLNASMVRSLRRYRDENPILTPVHGVEGTSVNNIPIAMGVRLEQRLGYSVESDIVQISKAGHTGASGWWRMQSHALFDGEVNAGRAYILLDDFVGMGGTYANLRGYIEHLGGRVLSCAALTGKPRSTILSLKAETLKSLRDIYEAEFETWWRDQFGYGFEGLTESEALYLIRAGDADVVRDRLSEAAQEGLADLSTSQSGQD